MRAYLYLSGAILTEVVGTTALKLSNGFESVALGGAAIGLYIGSFYFVSLALVDLPVGLVYATWSAVGIVGLAAIGVTVFDETVDAAALLGFLFVIAGILLLNVYSDAYTPA